jgi:hypothetical protein
MNSNRLSLAAAAFAVALAAIPTQPATAGPAAAVTGPAFARIVKMEHIPESLHWRPL